MKRDIVLAKPEAGAESVAEQALESAGRSLALAAAREAIDRLPRRTLDILRAVRVEGQDPREAGDTHNITCAAAEAHISWALQLLAVRVFGGPRSSD